MYEYIIGSLTEISPNFAIVENSGIGYFIKITLSTYSEVKNNKQAKLFLHQAVREDDVSLYGFVNKTERETFRLLNSVSGVSYTTSIIILSTLSPTEIKNAILSEDENRLKSVKGIGAKTAKRIILDLKDKIIKIDIGEHDGEITTKEFGIFDEVVSALTIMGFTKKDSEKAVKAVLKDNENITVENALKEALKKI